MKINKYIRETNRIIKYIFLMVNACFLASMLLDSWIISNKCLSVMIYLQFINQKTNFLVAKKK